MMRTALLGTAALFTLAIGASPAFAQTAAATPAAAAAVDDSTEIVVTAQKRKERLQDVPVAVSVLSGAQLAAQGGVNIENAQYLIPALNFRKSGTPLNQTVFLRGIGTSSASIAFEPSVSTVIDGVVFSRAGEAFTDLVDIERLEVLRGPQGTLFGKNTSAGVINIISKKPGTQLGGTVEGSWFFGNGSEYRGRAAIDVPLSDSIRTRLTGFYGTYDGNIFNDSASVNRRVNGYRHYGLRGVVEADVSETVKFTLIGDWRKSLDNCCAPVVAAPALNADGSTYQTFVNRAAIALPPLLGNNTRTVRQNTITRAEETSWGVSGQLDAELGGLTVTSISAYRVYNTRELREGDFVDRLYVGVNQTRDDGPQTGTTFSQELRLTSPSGSTVEYVVGAYYSRAATQRTFQRNTDICSASTLASINGLLTPCAAGSSTITNAVGIARFGSVFTNLAGFGQATWHVADSLRLIGGIRYTIDQLDAFHSRTTPVPGASNPPFDQGVFDSISPTFPAGTPTASNGVPYRQKTTAQNWSGKAGVQYDIVRNTTAYATYTRGYKGPALNIFFNLQPNGTAPIAAETSNAFELGLKNTLFGGKLTLNIAAYYAKYTNFQANNPDFLFNQRITRFTNAGDVSTRGFEIDLIARPAPDLSIAGGIAYTDAKVDRPQFTPGVNVADVVPAGVQLAYAPRWKGSLGGEYRLRGLDFGDLIFGAQGSYQSSQISNFVANTLIRRNSTIKPYGLVDASIGYADKADRFRITFQVKNLFNQHFAAAISDGGPLSGGNTGSSSYLYIIPREADRYFGLTGKVNF
jgi:iron complex outermembrane receptor protein